MPTVISLRVEQRSQLQMVIVLRASAVLQTIP